MGIALMVLARSLIDKIVLREVNTAKGIVEEMNVSVACVEGAAVVGCTLLISTSASGEGESSLNLGQDLGVTVLYFALGQLLLIGQLLVLNLVSKYMHNVDEQHAASLQQVDVQQAGEASTSAAGGEPSGAKPSSRRSSVTQQITKTTQGEAGADPQASNVAAGLSYGLETVVSALVIAIPIRVGYSILAAVIWVAIMLLVVIPIVHVFADKLILRTASAADNIMVHSNWGVSILIAAVKVGFALVANGVYQQNCSIASGSSSYSECDQSDLPVTTDLGKRLAHLAVPDIFKLQTCVDILVLIALILGAKFLLKLRFALAKGVGEFSKQWAEFNLDAYLVSRSNSAVAISLAGYVIAVSLSLAGVIDCPDDNVGWHGLWLLTCARLTLTLTLALTLTLTPNLTLALTLHPSPGTPPSAWCCSSSRRSSTTACCSGPSTTRRSCSTTTSPSRASRRARSSRAGASCRPC